MSLIKPKTYNVLQGEVYKCTENVEEQYPPPPQPRRDEYMTIFGKQ